MFGAPQHNTMAAADALGYYGPGQVPWSPYTQHAWYQGDDGCWYPYDPITGSPITWVAPVCQRGGGPWRRWGWPPRGYPSFGGGSWRRRWGSHHRGIFGTPVRNMPIVPRRRSPSRPGTWSSPVAAPRGRSPYRGDTTRSRSRSRSYSPSGSRSRSPRRGGLGRLRSGAQVNEMASESPLSAGCAICGQPSTQMCSACGSPIDRDECHHVHLANGACEEESSQYSE